MNSLRMQQLITLARLSSLASDMSGYVQPVDRVKKEETDNKMPLNEEELLTLSTLTGKQKKAYVKSLKEKYGKA